MAECHFIRDSRSPSHPLLLMAVACFGQRDRNTPDSGSSAPLDLSATHISSAI